MTHELIVTDVPERIVGVSKRQHGRIVRELLRAAGRRHVNTTLGQHFKKNSKTAPGGGYGYTERRPKYAQRKLRQGYGDTPMVRTGGTQRRLRTSAGHTIRATQTRLRIYLRARFPLVDQRRLEISAIAPDEAESMADRLAADYLAEAQRSIAAKSASLSRSRRGRRGS